MPDPSRLTPLGLSMLAQLPPPLRNSIDYQAVIHPMAREFELLEAAIETVRAQFNPATADVLLPAWEYELKLPVGGPPGSTIDQRRNAVTARILKRVDGSGADWEQAITDLVGPGWSYREHDPNDGTSPASGVIQVTLPFAINSAQFVDAQQRIAAMTDGNLQITWVSSAYFQLDVSPMDSTAFGG